MDKGKSKTDLRAAGKKRLEEYRQKRQQKGSSTKPSSTTALKALTESGQNVGENAVEEISRHASPLKTQRTASQKDGEVESVVDSVHGDALEERHGIDVVLDTSPESSVTSSIQRLEVGGGHLTPGTSEQSVESLREPGSSNGNLDDEDREAVYTILWENHEAEHSQRNEEWQESTFDGGASLNERGLQQGNCSSFWVDNESYRSESKEGLSTQRKLSGNFIGAADKFQSSEEWDEPSLSLVLSERRPVHDAEAEESRKHVLPVNLGFIGHSSFSSEESIEERMLLKRNDKLEKGNADTLSPRQFALGRCPSWLSEIKLQVDPKVNPTLSNLSSESELGEKLQSLQGMLQARDMELIDAISKLEGATRVISEQEEEAKANVQQNGRLKEELMKCYEDLGMLKSNVNMAEQKMLGLKNELHEVLDSFNSIPEERNSRTVGVTLSMNEMVTDVNFLAKAIVDQARRREMELQSANETAMTALLLESNTSKELLTKIELEFRDSRNAAQDITWLDGGSPPQSSLLDWATWLLDTLQNEHRKSEQYFQVTESMTKTANANTLQVQHLEEKINSLYVELSNQRSEKEAVAEDLRRSDLELQMVRNKLQEHVESNLVLESEVESARSMCRVESALAGIESIVGTSRFQGRPPPAATPSEWISWLIQVFREVSEELETFESASDALSLQLEVAKNNYSSLYEELSSQKSEHENLQSKHRAVHEMFGAERDSLLAEIQDLKDSSTEISRRELEFSEALKTVTNLEEALTLKERELSQLRAEADDLSLRSAQQDSNIQALMEERERLISEEAKAQRLLQEKIDSLHVELSNRQSATEAVAENLRRSDLQLQMVRIKLQEQVESNLVLESEVESARSMCRVESALAGIESIVGDSRFQGRPPPASTPSEWISWLIQIFREVSEELNTFESASDALSLQLEVAKNNYSSLYEELSSQKSEHENLRSKHRAVHEMFGAERDSLLAEIQDLKDSSTETSRRELEHSEALKTVTNLEEVLTLKERELSQLRAEADDLSLRSAQQDSNIQALMEERERLISEEAKAQRLLQEKIDSLHVELSNQQIATEAVAENLRRSDLQLQMVRIKLQEQVESNLVLESEVESARSMCRVESALAGIESIVGDSRFQGRPPPASTPSEWISWLIQIFREVSEELNTFESASDALSLQLEVAKNNYSSLYEELSSQKSEHENLRSKHRAVHEMFGAERDSLLAEIQDLKDSSTETSRRELEHSEALKTVTNLEEVLTLKERELSQLRAEADDLSLRSAQQDSNIQALMEERERLISEEAKAQRLLQEKIDSLHVELSNQQIATEAVAENLRRSDLQLQMVRIKLQEQVESNLVLESEVESARSMCRVESALAGIESIVGDSRFQGRPPPASTPSEWISWLIQIFREVSEELNTFESASDALSLQLEVAKNNYSSLYEELSSQKSEHENLQSKHRAVHEMFGAERDSLLAEIQDLKDSSTETSRRELELSEALKTVTNLEEVLALKERELSQLRAEANDLSLRSAQQDSNIQSLREERERLISEEAKAQRLLQEKIDSLHVELSNRQSATEAVAENLRRSDLQLQMVRNELQEQVESNLVLESEVEFARSMCRVESALAGIESIVGTSRFQGRPLPGSIPSEWISWLIQIFREVSEELNTFESASDALSLQLEVAKNNYSSLYEELSSQKSEHENLQSKHRAVHEMFGAERDSLLAEIQDLKDSSTETSRRELELSEALKTVTNLEEALTLKERELSQLRAEADDLSLRSAQQDSNIQSLMEERERLSCEVVDVKTQCNLLQAEVVQTANERSNLQSDVNQLEQKLGVVREKLNVAINKGKGLVKQRDSLKKSLVEETAKVETMISSHAKDVLSKDSELLEMRTQVESMGTQVQELQAEVSSLFEKATVYQQRLEAERRGLESVFFGIEIPRDLLPGDPIEKVKWLVSLLEGARSTTKFLEGELGSSRNALETLKAALRDTEERLQSVTVESLIAQEDISMYVKKVEEVESRANFDGTQYKNEVDDLTRALKEADLRQQAAWSRVKELERTVEKQQNTISASEVAHSKAVTKLTFTRNKLNLLVQDSQELVRECESLHKSLQERDIEIVELNHEVDNLKNVIHIEQSQRMDASSKTGLQLTLLQDELVRTNEKSAATMKDLREQLVSLQGLLKEKDSWLEGVRTKIEDLLLKGDNALWMEHNIIHQSKGDDDVADIHAQSMNGSLDFISAFTTLEERFNNLVAEAQMQRISSDKKEAQIQKLKKEFHDISIERTTLQAGVQAKTLEVERLQSEVNSKGVSVERNNSAESEIEELGTRSTWTGTGNPVTPHVRGPRRHSQADIAIDMVDANNSNLLSDMNDKEHGFSALTNSRLVPKAARILTDRFDGLWFVGGRILTRQPSARLGLAMYWIFIHIYMAMVFSRGIM